MLAAQLRGAALQTLHRTVNTNNRAKFTCPTQKNIPSNQAAHAPGLNSRILVSRLCKARTKCSSCTANCTSQIASSDKYLPPIGNSGRTFDALPHVQHSVPDKHSHADESCERHFNTWQQVVATIVALNWQRWQKFQRFALTLNLQSYTASHRDLDFCCDQSL